MPFSLPHANPMEQSPNQLPQKLPILKYTRQREVYTLSGVIYIHQPMLPAKCYCFNVAKILDNIELIQKRCMKTIFPGCSYDDILEMTNLPTLHDRRTTLCRTYVNKMNRRKHKLNALLPGRRTVPYALRASTGLPVPSAKTNRYKNSFIPWGLSNCQDC